MSERTALLVLSALLGIIHMTLVAFGAGASHVTAVLIGVMVSGLAVVHGAIWVLVGFDLWEAGGGASKD